eukprot:CAMPEP_0184686140 /NCGR_PEP_ID=MMETSP0312-20130426/21410_1 /TAXON_ID=31354 /ORGANISM="Compsopogon coeruleus, Strain SAG 36.94" /LENGTH=56 /DNA_ID=CAMNT_0027140921 /DNA_START=872 /DNA_END=1042 /DNA_ORIENTATION=+
MAYTVGGGVHLSPGIVFEIAPDNGNVRPTVQQNGALIPVPQASFSLLASEWYRRST